MQTDASETRTQLASAQPDSSPPQGSRLAGARLAEQRWLASIALFIIVGLLATLRYSGPSTQPANSHPFRSDALFERLHTILGDEEKIHTAGSLENELVRIRISGMLDQAGAEVVMKPLDDPDGERAGMVNVLARYPGQSRKRPIVLATHYDACPNGPGAGDAGQCVAAIFEIIEALKSDPLQHEIWLLFTDGEELGMWGARDIVKRKDLPWGNELPIVINFDARGDRGCALMYETHSDNLQAMRVSASAFAYPKVSSSLMVNVYQRLPNATDFTVFRKAGWIGWNFAVIAGAENYHTANDNIENLSPRSIQHFAQHGLSLLHALDQLSEAQLETLGQSEPAVFFDVLGYVLVLYPAAWNWIHLAVVVLIGIVGSGLAIRSLRARISRVILIDIAIVTMLIAFSFVGSWITLALKVSDLLPRPFTPYTAWYCLVFPTTAAFGWLVVGNLLSRHCNRTETLIGLWLAQVVIGAFACSSLFGGAYLLLWPALLTAILLSLETISRRMARASDVNSVIFCGLVAILYSPTYVLLAVAMGPTAGNLITVGTAMMLLPTLVPLASNGQSTEPDRV